MITRQTFLIAAATVALGASRAGAQEPDQEVYAAGVEPSDYQEDPNAPPEPYGPPPVPPEVEAAPVTGPGGSVCYVGPHPVDTRVAGGSAWDDSQGAHYHFYAPFDMRLFHLENGCYYFIGDPADFGYQGQTYSYYGAHPIHEGYGGGWCFMIGAHSHSWQPWNSGFVVSGSGYYWNGPYDSVFWSYWPYYSYYYRAYYPHYYGGGRWFRGYGGHVAPRIERVPPAYARGWRGPTYRGPTTPVTRGEWRGGSRGQPAPTVRANPHYGAPATGAWSGSGGWHGVPSPASPRSAPQPAAPARPAAPYSAPHPSSGGWSGGGWHGGGPAAASHPVAAPHPSPTPHQSAPSRAPSPSAPSPSHAGSAKSGWHR
jgi:hypothetical protein